MRLYFVLLMVSSLCAAQGAPPQIEAEHAAAVQKNPVGVAFTAAIVPKKSAQDQLRFRLSFTSNRPGTFTAELAPGGNAAAEDDFVFQGPGMQVPAHSMNGLFPGGVVCCGSDRRSLGRTARFGTSLLVIN